MHYRITHTTSYSYANPVTLAPHVLRLRPRCDVAQSLSFFSLEVDPAPTQQSEIIDLDGNPLLKIWFAPDPTTNLTANVVSEVKTYRSAPFSYLLEPWAVKLPFDYPSVLLAQLQPYISSAACNFPGGVDPSVVQLAHDIWNRVGGDTVPFLGELNQRIYEGCTYVVRDTGEPLPAGVTWSQKAGSCRDLALLFMDGCRAMGLAARFVSGYQEGDPDSNDRHLHAWAEVYLPGAGWRGYDPTQGLAVSDRHIALVASPTSRLAAPISGSLRSGAGTQSRLSYQIKIQVLGET